MDLPAMLDLDEVREWTPQLLEEFLARERSSDLDWRRFEIVDGVLVVSPQAAPAHESVMLRLGAPLLGAPPPGYIAAGAAGIAHCWRVETDPLRLITYRLVEGVYVQAGAWSAGETASIAEPFAVSLEVAALLP